MSKPTIAVIGTGVAGMSAAYFLRDQADITFYEKNHYPGGHTNTLTIPEDGRPVHIDSGFIVYNEITYPNLVRFFRELGVDTNPTSMSFSVQHIPTGLEYCGTGLNGLFAQRRNLFRPRFWKQLRDMAAFNKESVEVLEDTKYEGYTLFDYVKEKGWGDDFLYKFLVPMSSAVWSTPTDEMLAFPAVTLVRFFKNHGFLGLTTHYQWRTVVGGSRQYRDKILALFPGKVLLSDPAVRVVRENGKAAVTDARGERKVFDKVIMACHADEALSILADPSALEQGLLGKFKYLKNRATLHTDESLMPRRKLAWSSWNYLIREDKTGRLAATTIYDMNSLQQVSDKRNYFVSINDPGLIDPGKILWEGVYDHPLFDVPAIRAQKDLPQLNETGPVYFCGSYFKYGFHEDAFTSGLDAARVISRERIWA